MKETTIRFMQDFRCIADRCRHSCCIGWEIDIDEDSLAYYESIPGEFGKRLAKNIAKEEDCAHFCLDQHERCPFLNQNGLCDIYSTLGEEALCEICTEHPRFRNYIADNCEVGIGLCCEAAAQLILTQTQKWETVTLWEDEDETEEENAFAAWLLALRQKLFAILQSGTDTAVAAEQMIEAVGVTLPTCDIAQTLLGLERLDGAWDEYLFSIAAADTCLWEKDVPAFDNAFRNLLLYFLYRHLPSAENGEQARARVGFAYLAYRVIRAICAQKKICSFEDLLEIARLYSAEIEYSEDNTAALLALWEEET